MSFSAIPASSRQNSIDRYGKPLWCFFRENRSSSAAATNRPSLINAAAESPNVVRPRMYITGYPRFGRKRQILAGRHCRARFGLDRQNYTNSKPRRTNDNERREHRKYRAPQQQLRACQAFGTVEFQVYRPSSKSP